MLEKRELKYKINNNISYKMENYYLNEIDLQYQVNDNIVIIEKLQRNKNVRNYFLYYKENEVLPQKYLVIKLNNINITWTDSNNKNIALCFDKFINNDLYNKCIDINNILINKYKKKSMYAYNVAPFFYENEEKFYIRVYVSNLIKKVKLIELDVVFKNIWEDNDNKKAGFNIELI